RFCKLRFQDRPLDPEQRFVRKDYGPFRHGIDITPETDLSQEFQELPHEQRLPILAWNSGEVLQIRALKPKTTKIRQRIFQSTRHGKTATEGRNAKEQMKYGSF